MLPFNADERVHFPRGDRPGDGLVTGHSAPGRSSHPAWQSGENNSCTESAPARRNDGSCKRTDSRSFEGCSWGANGAPRRARACRLALRRRTRLGKLREAASEVVRGVHEWCRISSRSMRRGGPVRSGKPRRLTLRQARLRRALGCRLGRLLANGEAEWLPAAEPDRFVDWVRTGSGATASNMDGDLLLFRPAHEPAALLLCIGRGAIDRTALRSAGVGQGPTGQVRARPAGIEPATVGLEVRCSIR